MNEEVRNSIKSVLENNTITANNIVPIALNNNYQIDPTDPKYTYTDWDKFNPIDWTASRVDCHGFGEITVITNNNKPTLKLFIAKEIANVLEYGKVQDLTQIINVHDFRPLSVNSLNEINNLTKCVKHPINNRGMTILNYAAFNSAIMKSTKPNAKIIQQWVYGSVMPSIAETGQFGSNISLEYLLAENKQLQEIILNMATKLNELDTKLNKLLTFNQFNIPNKMYNLTDVCNYLNTNFKKPDQPGCTVDSLKHFMIEIKMIKGNFKPFVKFTNMKYIHADTNPMYNKSIKLTLSRSGIDHVVSELQNRNYI